MTRTVEGENGPAIVSAILLAPDAGGLAAKGFAPVDCAEAFADHGAETAWRDQMCRIAAEMPETMQGQIEQSLGERPAVFCGMAEQVLGPWDQASGISE